MGLMRLKIVDNKLYLNDTQLSGVSEYTLKNDSTGKGISTLTITLGVILERIDSESEQQ